MTRQLPNPAFHFFTSISLLLFSCLSANAQQGATGNSPQPVVVVPAPEPQPQAQDPLYPAATKPSSTALLLPRNRVHWGVDLNVTSQYIWRGFQANSTPSLQPNLWISYRGFTVSSWSNLARRGPNGQQWTEHDLTVDYSRTLTRKFSWSAGYINYVFPDLASGDVANEFYGGLRYDGKVSAGLKVFQNAGLSTGTYFQGNVGKSFPLGETVSLTTSFAVGYNRKMFIPVATFSDAVGSVAVSFPLGSRMRIAPNVNFSKSLDRGYFRNQWFGGVTISFSR